MKRNTKKRTEENIVRFVGRLGDGTYVIKHSDGHLERKKSQTDWARVDALTDEDIAKAVANDPDAAPIDIDWSDAVIMPMKKTAISIRVDEDVLKFFKQDGEGYQRRINAVLRSYMRQKAKPKKRA